MTTSRDNRVLAPVIVVAVVSAVLAFRDLARRTPDQVRGPKALWRALIVANAGNSTAYWLFGRRR